MKSQRVRQAVRIALGTSVALLAVACASSTPEPETASTKDNSQDEEAYPDSDLSDEEFWAKQEADEKAAAKSDEEEADEGFEEDDDDSDE